MLNYQRVCFICDVPFIAWSPGHIRSSKQGDIQWLTVYIRRESKSLNAQMEKVPYHPDKTSKEESHSYHYGDVWSILKGTIYGSKWTIRLSQKHVLRYICTQRERERTKHKVRIDCVKCTCGMKNNHRYHRSRHQELVHRSGQDSKMPWLLRKCTSTSSCTAYSPKGSLGSALPGWENHPLIRGFCVSKSLRWGQFCSTDDSVRLTWFFPLEMDTCNMGTY